MTTNETGAETSTEVGTPAAHAASIANAVNASNITNAASTKAPAKKRAVKRHAATAAAKTTASKAQKAENQSEQARAIAAQKDAVRREALARRQELRPAVRSSRSRDICNQLITWLRGLDLKSHDGHQPTIAVYSALRTEVDLDRFIRGVYAMGYRIAFPCMIPQGRANEAMCMRAVSCAGYVGGSAPFVIDPMKAWGPAVAEEQRVIANHPNGSGRRFIPSRTKSAVPPKDDTRFPVVTPDELDAVIVPMSAFDAEGHRLGYGRGAYDRYLPHLPETCAVTGVAFAEQEVEAVPVDANDVTMPRIISA